MLSQFTNLFMGKGLIPMIIILVGLLFCMIEIIVPGFGVMGIIGGIATLGGFVTYIIMGLTGTQVLIILIMILLVAMLPIVLISVFARLGLLGKSPLIQSKTSIPEDYEKASREYRKLVGKEGFAATVFNPGGKLLLDGKTYDAVSDCQFIEKGERVKVISVENNTILVKKG